MVVSMFISTSRNYSSYPSSPTVLCLNCYNVIYCKCSVILGTYHTLSLQAGSANRHHRLLTSHQINHHTVKMKFKSIAISWCYWFNSTTATDQCCFERSTIASRLYHLSQCNHAVRGAPSSSNTMFMIHSWQLVVLFKFPIVYIILCNINCKYI